MLDVAKVVAAFDAEAAFAADEACPECGVEVS